MSGRDLNWYEARLADGFKFAAIVHVLHIVHFCLIIFTRNCHILVSYKTTKLILSCIIHRYVYNQWHVVGESGM